MSEKLTICVMSSDVSGAPAPPSARRLRASTPPDWRALDEAQIGVELLTLLRHAGRLKGEPRIAPDGSPSVASIVSVWLLSQVGLAVGIPRLVNLRQVRREDLTSTAGVARLVHGALAGRPGQAVAVAG